MGSAQSARRTQPGGGSAARAGDGGGASLRRPPPSPRLGALPCAPAGRTFSAGGASRPAPGRPGRARREGGSAGLSPPTFTARIAPTSPFPPGAVERYLSVVTRTPVAGSRGPPPPARLSTWTDCPQCVLTASRRPGGDRPSSAGARGLRRCRLPTRPVLKHGPRSLTRARVRGLGSKPRGAMKVKGGSSPPQVGSRRRRAPGAPPARLARSVGEVEHERAR